VISGAFGLAFASGVVDDVFCAMQAIAMQKKALVERIIFFMVIFCFIVLYALLGMQS
jgi:hypothetical protein